MTPPLLLQYVYCRAMRRRGSRLIDAATFLSATCKPNLVRFQANTGHQLDMVAIRLFSRKLQHTQHSYV